MIIKPIVLTGLMGAGKTVTGQALAKECRVPFLDTDDLISEKEQLSVSSIFEEKGEPYFRQCETQCLYDQDWSLPFVLSTGGGLFITPINQEFLLEKAFVVHLKVAMDVLKKRLVGDTAKRPLLNHEDWGKKLMAIAKVREAAYERAHWTYDVYDEPLDVIVNTIMKKIG